MTKKKELIAVELMDLMNVSQAIMIMEAWHLKMTIPSLLHALQKLMKAGVSTKALQVMTDGPRWTDTDDKPVCEEGHELEDEEPDTNIKLKKSKKKKGVIAQEQISAAVAAKMTNQVQG